MSSSDARAAFQPDPLYGPAAFVADVPEDGAALAAAGASPPQGIEARIEAAHRAGREEARAELPLAEAEALSGAARAFTDAAGAAVALRSRYLREQRAALVDLALEIAEWVVRHHVEADRERLADAVEGALQGFDGSASVTLHLAPSDRAALESGGAESLAALSESRGIELAEDDALRSGDYRLVAGERRVDGSVSAVLQRLREGLLALTDSAEGGEDAQ